MEYGPHKREQALCWLLDMCVLELPDLLLHLKPLNPFLLKVSLIVVYFKMFFVAALTYHKILELVLSMQWSAYVLQH